MITVNDTAKVKLENLRKESNYDENYFVRVGVAGGGCSGLTYILDLIIT